MTMRAPAPLRVGLVIPSLAVGGAEQHVVKLSRALQGSDISATIYLLCRDLPRSLAAELVDGQPVRVSPFSHRDPRIAAWLAGWWRRDRIAVAHSFLWTADLIAAAARLLVPGVRLVVSERGERSTDYHRGVRRALDRLFTFPAADRIVPNSRFGAALVERLGANPRKIEPIANGADLPALDRLARVDLRAHLGWPASALIVGTACRLVEEKGVDVLLRAVASCAVTADVRAVVVGDGPDRAGLEALSRSSDSRAGWCLSD